MTVKEQIEANKAEAQKRIATALREIQTSDFLFAACDLRAAKDLIYTCNVLQNEPEDKEMENT